MNQYSSVETKISKSLSLKKRPVAVKFLETPPKGVRKFEGAEPSGCSFWRIAASGKTFYTVASDHYNCAVGSHTHNIPLPPERAKELEQTLSFMADISYIKMEEVPGIPQLAKMPGAVVYSPLGDAPVDPDVVIFAARQRRSCCCKKRLTALGARRNFRCWGVPLAWQSRRRWRKEPSPVPGASAIESTRTWRMANSTRWCREKIWSASRMSSRRLPPPMRSFTSIIALAARKFRRSRSRV